jgi:hypothetical protein
MKILDLFRSKPERKTREMILRENKASNLRRHIAEILICNAADFGIPLRPPGSAADNPDKHICYIYGYYEYVYFQLYHFRKAISKNGQNTDAMELERDMFEMIPESVINGFWPTITATMRQKMVAEFGANMEAAFAEYDKCYLDHDPTNGLDASVFKLKEFVYSAFQSSPHPKEETNMINHIRGRFGELDIENVVANNLRAKK